LWLNSGVPLRLGFRVEGGESIEDFLDGFPSVKREQVFVVIEAGKLKMLEASGV
jgi:uncharacterized protein (DUF433 family)